MKWTMRLVLFKFELFLQNFLATCYYLGQESWVFDPICLFVCQKDYRNTMDPNSMKLGARVWLKEYPHHILELKIQITGQIHKVFIFINIVR